MVADTFDQAALNLETIKDEIEHNERFSYYFGHLKNPGKWNEGEIELMSGIKVMAKGTGQRIRGLKWGPYRPDLIMIDDFESEHNTDTARIRAKVARWMMGAVLPSVAPKYQVILTGTIVHDKAFLRKIDQNSHWKTREYQAIKEDGTPLWPARYSLKDLEAIKDRYASMDQLDDWYREYCNQARSPETVDLLGRGMAQFYDPKRVIYNWGGFYLQMPDGANPVPLAIFMGVDPAMGKEAGDDTALITIGITPSNDVYIINIEKGKIGPLRTIDRMFALHKIYRHQRIGIESVAYQEALIEMARAECLVRGQYPSFIPVPTKGERKNARIMSMEPYFSRGRIHFRMDHDQDRWLIRQAENFDQEKTENEDDGLDGLYIAILIGDAARKVAFKDGEPYNRANPMETNWAVL